MLERLAAVFQVDILVVIYGQLPKQEEEVAAMDEKTKKRHIRGAVLFGCIALACLILHLASRETMLNAYHRYEIPSFWWLMAVSMPLFYFFIALSGMNGLGLLGTLRIQNVPLRRSLFLLSAVFLAVCVIFPVVLFQFQLSLGDAWGRYVFWLYYGITKYPALLILPGVGVYFGWER